MKELTLAIEIHIAAALVSIVIGAVVLTRKKGTYLHRIVGRIWWLAMIVTVLSSFGITELGGIWGWSWIHLLSIYTLVALMMALFHVRRGNISRHKQNMLGSLAGLVIAGCFALLPGRRMGDFLLSLI